MKMSASSFSKVLFYVDYCKLSASRIWNQSAFRTICQNIQLLPVLIFHLNLYKKNRSTLGQKKSSILKQCVELGFSVKAIPHHFLHFVR